MKEMKTQINVKEILNHIINHQDDPESDDEISKKVSRLRNELLEKLKEICEVDEEDFFLDMMIFELIDLWEARFTTEKAGETASYHGFIGSTIRERCSQKDFNSGMGIATLIGELTKEVGDSPFLMSRNPKKLIIQVRSYIQKRLRLE